MSAELLIIFVKAPLAGQVKTRLAEEIGAEAACAAYRRLVEDLFRGLQALGCVEVRYTPDDAREEIQPWLAKGWGAQPQGVGDLGARLERAFDDAFAAGARRVVAIGSDCPEVSVSDIAAAWVALQSNDLVIGPATDGGYWLIGLRAPQPALFRGMAWSTDNVLEETLKRARAAGQALQQLRVLSDVDTAVDWRRFLGTRENKLRFAASFGCLTPVADTHSMNVETAVKERYSAAAQQRVETLCCPVEYDRHYLKVIPSEVIERDYGCGDPSKFLRPGETVLDLGSGAGKICFIAAQVVGAAGKVIGVDMNDDMLALARHHRQAVGDALGFHNVEFRKGRIQDLALDLERLDAELKAHPINSADAFLSAETLAEELRLRHPLVAADSIDVVVSNCVLNLVEPRAKQQLFHELFRVLKNGGRAVISDIVSDEAVPAALQNDPELWSGCISGALTEEGFLRAFEDAGFYGVRILQRDATPWRAVHGIEFRSLIVEAFKGKQGPCFERKQAVIYKGPFKEVLDDDHHRMERGRRYAVCDKTYQLLQKAPYREFFEFVEPREEVPLASAPPFPCGPMRMRQPGETKGGDYQATTPPSQCCDAGGCC